MPRSSPRNLAGIDAFIVDLDGTTYLGDILIRGAKRFFSRLRAADTAS